MNKAELIDALTERLGNRKTAADAVDGLVDVVVRSVHKGDKVTITGFGVFEKRARAARMARNPRTGEAVRVKKTTVPAFRPGTTFKDVVSGAKKLPRATSAAKQAAGSGRGATTATGRAASGSGTARTAAARSTATKASTTKAAAAAKSSTAKSSAAKPSAAKSSAAKSSTAKPSAAKSSTAKSNTAKSNTAKSNTAKSNNAVAKAPAKSGTNKAVKKSSTK
ncbi:MAG: HU family DNA-binding protein [Pseudonocardiaceae bacterium]|nr:HU family DNA-binding protein [Pseudonocardiaceae bacterium]